MILSSKVELPKNWRVTCSGAFIGFRLRLSAFNHQLFDPPEFVRLGSKEPAVLKQGYVATNNSCLFAHRNGANAS